jgi:hypothetical protein
MAGFERFAQDFQYFPVEFGQFVEKQGAVMRERDFAGLRITAAVISSNSCDQAMNKSIS